ncbi:MAG TPA: HAMP domain-containing sensor histidine kinase [Patescibacteria group bacterium]|nr:HAMP domain-containing sensor histidine kinase [Patescibacteria group bacterium]
MSLSQYILDAREQYRLEIRERNTWLARLRWYYLLVLAAVSILASFLAHDNLIQTRMAVLTTVSVGLVINLVIWSLTKLKNRHVRYYQVIAVVQLCLDVSLAAIVIYTSGGLTGRGTALFAIPVVGAGLLFGQGFAYFAAALSSIGYGLSLALYRHTHPGVYQLHRITLPVVFYSAVFFIIAIIVSSYSSRNASNEREKSYKELLALLRHQLYHPSSVIAAIIDMLEHGKHYADWPSGDKAYLQQLKHQNQRLHNMIENLLKSVTSQNDEVTNKKVFDMVKLLNEESVACATGAKRVEDLETQLPHKVIEVEGDAELLRTAVDNIIENAFNYTERGTPVIISATEENYKVTISVHDKGKGISADDQREIFKMFSKMSSRISGDPENLYDSGLGLYVSKLIIERHRGTLELSSSADYGTNVTITLYKRLI